MADPKRSAISYLKLVVAGAELVLRDSSQRLFDVVAAAGPSDLAAGCTVNWCAHI